MKYLSLFSVLLPSIRRTVEGGFDYHIWIGIYYPYHISNDGHVMTMIMMALIIGYDSDDAYFSNTNVSAQITGWCNAQMTWLSNHARGIKICMCDTTNIPIIFTHFTRKLTRCIGIIA
jgi:hypothetical protein